MLNGDEKKRSHDPVSDRGADGVLASPSPKV